MSRGGGGGGGWMGPMGTVGGITRTYGLQNHFGRDLPEGASQISRVTLRRIQGYFAPYKRMWVIVLICIVVNAGLAVLPPLAVGYIIGDALPNGKPGLLALLVLAIVALAVATGLIGVLQQTLTNKAGQGIMYDLRNELYRHLQRMSLGFFTVTRSGEIVSRVNNDVNAVQAVATNSLVSILDNFARFTITAATLFALNWKMALIALAVVPAFYFPALVVGRIRRRLSTQTQESQASLLAFMNERLHVGGLLLTNIFGQRRQDTGIFADRSGSVRDLSVRQAVVGRWLFAILSTFSAVGPALIYWYGGVRIYSGAADDVQKEIGFLVAYVALMTQLYRPMVQLATVYVDIQASVGVFERIFEYLDLVPDVRDPEHAVPLERTRGHLAFENVSFAYPTASPRSELGTGIGNGSGDPDDDGPRLALRDVSFEVRPGEQVALVGPSGAGKTTITYLVPRFYDPLEGRVSLDGHDLRSLAQEQLRRHVGVVTQETFLFHDSIRSNLLYAKPGATEAEMIEACRAANIHEFIAALPDGYDTVVGERGFRLSGGEKQRVSIARAILKDPAILILDEATSSLDATSEHLIQTALERLLSGRTSLIIAHRLSTILKSDRIVVMEAGRVTDIGRHEDLVARDGLYAALFRQQFGHVLDLNGNGRPLVGA